MNTNSWDKQSIFENTFELKEDGVVQVSVDKVSGGDPLLAWLGITQKADTEALSETIESIHGEMSGMNAEEYSEQLWTELEQELADAEKALSLEGISQKKCDALQAKLMSTLQKLKDSQKNPFQTLSLVPSQIRNLHPSRTLRLRLFPKRSTRFSMC